MIKEKLLIIHMDDIGMSYAANEAATRLFERGIVTSASLLIPCSWSHDFIKWWSNHKQYDVGVHFTVTCEWDACRWGPVSDKKDVPGLLDDEAFMPRKVNQVVERARGDEVENEMRCQINLAKYWGLEPTHVDRHMWGVTATPEFFQRYITIAKQHGVPPQICRDEAKNASATPKLDHMISAGDYVDYKMKKAYLRNVLESISPGLTQLTIHPVIETPEIKAIIPSWQQRYMDYMVFMDDETADIIDELGIKPVTWSDIADMRALF
ncbi:polysaccharide deacetylase family protein [Mahella australiensis]|uniref:YdjC family protein n=1 Tax=Mahella australiensis (strain DSM 15567 / CIP 107919 / 50-1 BON) TaxID=697281 RepID=F4A0S5_MAHA5|nr:polysaccharide deacetylase family protein [Mahella australiensis]AEE96971.1 YdjC family protein [Mahella australiensis 50-1 BON]